MEAENLLALFNIIDIHFVFIRFYVIIAQNQINYSFTEPMVKPDTKYCWKNG